jgi:hypothetical protein
MGRRLAAGRSPLGGRGHFAETLELAAGAVARKLGGAANFLSHLMQDLARLLEDGGGPPLQVGGVLLRRFLTIPVVS